MANQDGAERCRSRPALRRSGGAGAGWSRSWSPTRHGMASRSTRASTPRRWSGPRGIRPSRPWCSCTAPVTCRTCTATGRVVLPRVHVPPPAGGEGLRGARHRLPRPAPATAATGAPASTAAWAARISTTSSTAPHYLVKQHGVDPRAHRRLRRQLRRLHHADGDVHRARRRSPRAPRCGRSPTGRTTTIPTPPTSSTSRRTTSRPIARARRSTSPRASRARC